MPRPHGASVFLLALAVLLAPAAAARAQFRTPFSIYPAVNITESKANRRALEAFDWRGEDRRGVVDRSGFIYLAFACGLWFGERGPSGITQRWPVAGPHNFDSHTLARHIEKVRADVREQIPEGFTGFVCIDYEGAFCWGQASPEQKSAWESRQRTVAPERLSSLRGGAREDYLRRTFNTRMEDIITATLTAARDERPAIKIGFYAQPLQEYWGWFDPAKAQSIRTINDTELAWLWQAVDVVYPSTYQFYAVVDEPVNGRGHGEQTLAACQHYIASSILEAMRVAEKGKDGKRLPVICWVWWRYHDNGGAFADDYTMGKGFLREDELRETLSLPRALGCRGIVLFDYLATPEHVGRTQAYYDRTALPIFRSLSR